MNDAELNKRFDDIHELLKALRENIEVLNKISVSFNALIELLLAKGLIEAEELLPKIEAKMKEYKESRSKHTDDLRNGDQKEPYSPN